MCTRNGVPMSYYENSHTDYYERDLSEMIRLYDHLKKVYDSLLHDIRGLGFRLDDYVRQSNAEIPKQVDAAIKRYEQEVEIYKKRCDINYQNIQRILEDSKKYNDKRFDSIEKDIRTWHKHLSDHEQYLLKLVSSLDTEMQNMFTEWQEEFKHYSELVDFRMDTWRLFARGLDYENKLWTRGLVDDLQKQVEEIVREDGTIVFNPVRGDYTSLGVFIMDLWGDVLPMPWGYSAEEFDCDTEVTCEYWDKHQNLTCITWYINGKNVLHWKERKERINSWISGRKVYWREAIREIYPLLFKLLGSIKAKEYDDWSITADEYEKLEITAREYDFGIARDVLNPEEGA